MTVLIFDLYRDGKGSKMNKKYYFSLLESRSNRLKELVDMGAPTEIIHKEALLVAEAAKLIDPKLRVQNEEQRIQSATG